MLDLLDCMLPGFQWFVLCLREERGKNHSILWNEATLGLAGTESKFDLVNQKSGFPLLCNLVYFIFQSCVFFMTFMLLRLAILLPAQLFTSSE